MRFTNPPEEVVARLLQDSRTIAVVGLSDNPARPSHDVASYLRRVGYRIVPVNPTLATWEGLTAYPSLLAAKKAGETIDLVDVFRRPEEVDAPTDEAIEVGARGIWYQLGVVNEAAARRAQDAGLVVVMDRCSKVDHRRLVQ